jgi:DNA-binding response OmpR family regulator
MNGLLILSNIRELFFDLSQEMENDGFLVNIIPCQHYRQVDLNDYEVIILNLDCSEDTNNKQYIETLRSCFDAPIFVFSKTKSEIVESYYLDLGADGFINYPIPKIQTVARIRAILRRCENNHYSHQNIYSFGPYQINYNNYTITKGDEEIRLTRKEFTILKILVENSDSVISRDRLIQAIYAWDTSATDNALNIHINRLRKNSTCPMSIRLFRPSGVWDIRSMFLPQTKNNRIAFL